MTVRIVGFIVGLLFATRAIDQYRRARLSRLELLASVGVATAISVVSIWPAVTNFLADLFRLDNRLFALLVAASLLSFLIHLVFATRIHDLEERMGELVRRLAVSDAEAMRSEGDDRDGARSEILIVIPAYDEAESIGPVLDSLPTEIAGLRAGAVVVVDGSSDDTAFIAADRGHVIAEHVINRGQGDALRTGFEVAISEGARIVMTMDADGQHNPDDLEALVRPILDGEADYVQGSRFLGEYDDSGSVRSYGIRFFAALLRLFGRVDITDATNGFRAIRSDALRRFELRETRFSAAEFVLEGAQLGLRMTEVPVHIRRREHGESKKPRRLGYPLGYLRVVLRTWLRQHRRHAGARL